MSHLVVMCALMSMSISLNSADVGCCLDHSMNHSLSNHPLYSDDVVLIVALAIGLQTLVSVFSNVKTVKSLKN